MPYIGNTTSDFSIDTGNITNRAVTATKLSPSSVGSNGQVLSVDGSGNLQWGNDANAPEGTAVLSTGESGTTKYLRVDGDGTCSWQLAVDATKTTLTGSTNNTICTVTGANAIQGEASLTYNGQDTLSLDHSATNENSYLKIAADDNRRKALVFDSGGTTRGVIGIGDSDEAVATTLFLSASSNVGGVSPHLVIKSDGNVGIGTTSPGTNLHIQNTSANPQIRISSANDGICELQFGDQSDTVRGNIIYRNGSAGDALCFNGYNNTECMRIDSSGRVSIQGAATRAHLEVRSSGGSNTKLTAVFGADEGVTTGALTDDTDKGCRIGIQHYDTDALPFAWISAASGTSANSINMGGGTSLMNAATSVGIYTASNNTTATGTKRFEIASDGTLSKYYDATTVQAGFGGSGQVNGITALPSMAATPFVVGRDTGSTRSAHFAGHLKFDSGYGIDFSATADSGGANIAENLNDYEDGRFTPKVYYGTGTDEPTYSWRYGHYVKIGRQVTVWFSLGITGFNPSPDVDEVYIANLPFQNDDPNSQWKYLNMLYDYSSASGWGFGSNDQQMFLALYDEKTKIRIVKTGGGHINTADVGSGQRWSSSFSYFTDS